MTKSRTVSMTMTPAMLNKAGDKDLPLLEATAATTETP